MALTATTLNGAIGAHDTSLRLTSGTSVVAGSLIKIGSEFVRVLDITNTPTFGVQRGQLGTAAVPHGTLSAAVHGASTDFTVETPARIYTYGVDGAIATAPGFIQLAKGSAGAYTLADPGLAQDGDTLVITSISAYAHVITGVTIWDGTATVNTTLTFANVIGASCTLAAERGKWNVISLNAVTPAP
jgi:hypothetical protein